MMDALVHLTETIRCKLDKKDHIADVFLDLSKAFDSIDHENFFAKFETLSFTVSAENIIINFLRFNDTFHCVKVNNVELDWLKLIRGASQGTVRGPLLRNFYINNLQFNIVYNIFQYADDTVIYSSEKKVQDSLDFIEKDVKKLFDYFDCNYLRLNADKTEFIVFGSTASKDMSVTVDGQKKEKK